MRHQGAYTPAARDDAETFRGTLLQKLAYSEDELAIDVLRELAADARMIQMRDHILRLVNERLERNADLRTWSPRDLRVFAQEYEVDPKNDQELFSITVRRLRDLKLDVEKADNSLRDELHVTDEEFRLRRWLARKLNERSRNRYVVPQEEEIDMQHRPDLRIHNPKAGVVSIEVKWADKWTLEELVAGLETQLVGQYLRAHRSRYGVYVVGFVGKKQSWMERSSGARLEFADVVERLRAIADHVLRTHPGLGDLRVIDIDFMEPRH